MYDIGKFYQAADVEDAVRALVEDPEAVVISGGSDVQMCIRDRVYTVQASDSSTFSSL